MMSEQPFIDFEGRRVLVTGASSGLGRAIAVELGRRGASVILTGRNTAALAKTAEKLGAARSESVVLDLRDATAVFPAVKALAETGGRIYGLCHCAGVVETRPLSAIKLESLRTMLEVNLAAGIELARAVTRRDVMTEEGGSILFISSIYGRVGMAAEIGYSATKGAVTSAARSMAIELARRKVRVNTLSPGLVHTPMTDGALSVLSDEQKRKLEEGYPLGPGTPEDIARAAVFLLAPQNSWITGTDLVVDGGYTAR